MLCHIKLILCILNSKEKTSLIKEYITYTYKQIYLYSCEKKMLVAQSCLILRPLNCSPPGSSVHGIFSARILEWQPFPSQGDLSNQQIKPRSPALQADSLLSEPLWKPCVYMCISVILVKIIVNNLCRNSLIIATVIFFN